MLFMKSSLIWHGSLCLALFFSACSSPPLPPQLERIFKDQERAIFSVSSDERFLAYRKTGPASYELWLHDLQRQKADRLLESEGSITTARFSPNGRYLSVFVENGFSEKYRIMIFDAAKSPPVKVLESENEVTGTQLSWAPRSTFAAYKTSKDKNAALVLLFPGTGSIREAAGFPADVSRFAISQNEREILMLTTAGQLLVYDWKRQESAALKIPRYHRVVDIFALPKSPGYLLHTKHSNGRRASLLVYAVNRSSVVSLRPERCRGRGPVRLSAPTEIESPLPSSNKRIALTYRQGLSQTLAVFERNPGSSRFHRTETSIKGGIAFPVAWSIDGRRLFSTWESHNTPPQLVRLTQRERNWRHEKVNMPGSSGGAYPFEFKSEVLGSLAGSPVYGAIYAPACSAEVKGALIYLHGANPQAAKDQWLPFVAAFNSVGWAVVGLNYAGSSFYGPEHERLNAVNPNRSTPRELPVAKEYIERTWGLGSDRVIIMGLSAGIAVGLYSAFVLGEPYYGIIDVSGAISYYHPNFNADSLRVGWIQTYQGQYDRLLSGKDALVRSFSGRTTGAAPNVTSTVVPNERHVFFRPSTWRLIVGNAFRRLSRDGLLGDECLPLLPASSES